jgi:hypothetical protein
MVDLDVNDLCHSVIIAGNSGEARNVLQKGV